MIILNLDGEQFQENGKPVDLDTFLVKALVANLKGDELVPAKVKRHRFDIAKRIKHGGATCVVKSDMPVIEEVLWRAYAVEVAGCVWDAITEVVDG